MAKFAYGSGVNRGDLNKAGVWLALVGALYVGGLLGRGPSIDPTTEPLAFAQFISSTRGIASAMIYVLGMAMHIVGVLVAIRGVSAAHPRFAILSALLTIFALVLTAAVIGPFIYTWPAITQSYLEGNTRAMEVVKHAAGPLFVGSVLLEGILLTAGGILFGQVLSKAGVPRWITLCYALSAPLYATPIPGFFVEVSGLMLLLVAGIGLARLDQGESAARA
jgi:hypothetical protein